MNRREFVAISMILGLFAIFRQELWAEALKRLDPTLVRYSGPLLAKIQDLLSRMDQGLISPESVVSQLATWYAQHDLDKEFSQWYPEVRTDGTKHFYLIKSGDNPNGSFFTMDMHYIPAKTSIPPHTHHDFLSTHVVLRGEVLLRQWERSLDRSGLANNQYRIYYPKGQQADTLLKGGDAFLATELQTNGHFFSAGDEPVLIFNFQAIHVPGVDFNDVHIEIRDYFDLSKGELDSSGNLVVSSMSEDEAYATYAPHQISQYKR